MTNYLSLKDRYADYFRIGAAVNQETILTEEELLKQHFNSLTAENEMKFEHLQPKEGIFTFEKADQMASFAKENQIEMRGHTLVWHNQTPQWVFEGNKGSLLTRQQLLNRMESHIKTVMTHFKDPFYTWDVVNEAVEDRGSQLLRSSPWSTIIGDDFIDHAFYFAKEARPDVKLYYNDYNESSPVKREKIYQLVKSLVERDVPIDGIGLQCHWSLDTPAIDDIRQAIERYASLGLSLEITEMDVSVFEFENHRTDLTQATKEMLDKQAARYDQIFSLFREYHQHIDTVTFWGVSDRYTWLNDFPVENRKNWPFIFDEKGQAKESFKKIMTFK